MRLNADGSRDTNFPAWVTGGWVNAIALQPDGKVVIGGSFTAVNIVARTNIARLNSNGTLDTGFQNGMAGVFSGGNSHCSRVEFQNLLEQEVDITARGQPIHLEAVAILADDVEGIGAD